MNLAFVSFDQRAVQQWQGVSVNFGEVLMIIAVGLGAGVVAARLAAPLTSDDAPESASAPAMDLKPGEAAVWTSTLHARWPLLTAVVTVVVAVPIGVFGEVWLGILWLVLALGIATFGRIRTTADAAGLRVAFGLFGWPRVSIPASRIERATSVEVQPLQWGGWGYRGSLKLMGRASVVVRKGPGIRLDLTDGKVFVVTTDDPETGVSVLNAGLAESKQRHKSSD